MRESMRRGEDIPAAGAHNAQCIAYDFLNFLRAFVWQVRLRGDPAPKAQTAAVFRFYLCDIIDFGLKSLIAIQPDFDQIVENVLYISAGMLEDKFSVGFCARIHFCHARFDKFFPKGRTHDHAALLPPIVAEIDPVKGIFVENIDDFQVEIANSVQ